MNEIQTFNFEDHGVRSLLIDETPWFIGKDVAQALGYSNSRDAISRHVDQEDKEVVKHDTLGGVQNITIINESGIYALIFGSKLESAKRFKRWVTSEVLPQIRKTGSFNNPVNTSEYVEALKEVNTLASDLPNRYEVIKAILKPFGVELPDQIELKQRVTYSESVTQFVEHVGLDSILDRLIHDVHNDYVNFCKILGATPLTSNRLSRQLKIQYRIKSEAVWNPESGSNKRVYKKIGG